MPATLLRPLIVSLAILLPAGCVTLPTDRGTAQPVGNNEHTVANGLREALIVGTRRTIERTNRNDGYLADALIRIALPEELRSVSTRLRQVGLGSQVNELEVAMNRAAEQAAGEAASIFVDAIRSMRPADAYALLNGESDAATRYLRERSEPALRASYRPIVRSRMTNVDAYGYYQTIADSWNRLPLVQPLSLNLEDYVTEQALDGLFVILAQEEARIRKDPVARTTDLLRHVFGNN
ncbi:MAG: DUF4197 domain-containing protein [Aquisalimonadaceae bacterium]